jgi:prolyl oligopeptidase
MMVQTLSKMPVTQVEPVTDTMHGVAITDPYRWLEDQNSSRTREWLEQQRVYARCHLDGIAGRDRIRKRIKEFLAIETYDSLQKAGNRYFFRKRLPEQEQPCIYMREGSDGEDQLLVDPTERGTGLHTAVKPLQISLDGRLLLYEVKEGGERAGTFELLEIQTRRRLVDQLPRGHLRGFAFGYNSKTFYYVHEAANAKRPFYRAAYHHVLGTQFTEDREIFFAGESEKIRLGLFCGYKRLAIMVYHFLEKTLTDIYLKSLDTEDLPVSIFHRIGYSLGLRLLDNRILAITNREAPNRRIVEIRLRDQESPELIDIVPENDAAITGWIVAGDRIVVSYAKEMVHKIRIFDLHGLNMGEVAVRSDETVRIVGGSPDSDEVLLETESFVEPINIFRCSSKSTDRIRWARRNIPLDREKYEHRLVSYISKDGTSIPMYLVGRHEILDSGSAPTIMTSYGGYGVSMTPQFSIFVAFLVEHGCLFALPNIRGGSEFGAEWHRAAKRRNRQTAYDDFLFAAEWLLATGRTAPGKLAIFGGSNSGLLVGAALTQRPDLYRAVVCMVPMLDMLRYHLFDNAHVWKEEFGTAEDADDFAALAKYSPYHRVCEGVAYPATMIVSGDADHNCNPLHARKMTARLQSANISEHPIFLDYNQFRGHSPVLPLSERIEALTDRMAFLCDQLQLPV